MTNPVYYSPVFTTHTSAFKPVIPAQKGVYQHPVSTNGAWQVIKSDAVYSSIPSAAFSIYPVAVPAQFYPSFQLYGRLQPQPQQPIQPETVESIVPASPVKIEPFIPPQTDRTGDRKRSRDEVMSSFDDEEFDPNEKYAKQAISDISGVEKRRRLWRKRDDEMLLAMAQNPEFQYQGMGNNPTIKLDWRRIQPKLPEKLRASCVDRWKRHVDPSIVRTPWTEDEKQKLIKAVKARGKIEFKKRSNNLWKSIAESIPGRAPFQCKNEYEKLIKQSTE
jgi:Myb-like DNA-binding domain